MVLYQHALSLSNIYDVFSTQILQDKHYRLMVQHLSQKTQYPHQLSKPSADGCLMPSKSTFRRTQSSSRPSCLDKHALTPFLHQHFGLIIFSFITLQTLPHLIINYYPPILPKAQTYSPSIQTLVHFPLFPLAPHINHYMTSSLQTTLFFLTFFFIFLHRNIAIPQVEMHWNHACTALDFWFFGYYSQFPLKLPLQTSMSPGVIGQV